MKWFSCMAAVALGTLTACAGPAENSDNSDTVAAFRDFGAAAGTVHDHYVTPIDLRRILIPALRGIEHQPSPAQGAAQRIVESAIASIQAMPADYTLLKVGSWPADNSAAIAKAERTNDGFSMVVIFVNTVTSVSALPGAPSVPLLLHAATVNMLDNIDPMTRYIQAPADRETALEVLQTPADQPLIPGTDIPDGCYGPCIDMIRPNARWGLIGNLLYVHVSAFDPATAFTIQFAYQQAEKRDGGKLRGVILDLRSNAGGLLRATADIAGLFLPKGAPIATIRNRPRGDETLTAASHDITNGLPLAVLINGKTSNGAEIVAGALQFNHRAVVVGASTAGSGYIMTLIPLRGSGLMLLTTGQIVLSSGQLLQSHGIVPDVAVEQPNASEVLGAPASEDAMHDWNPQDDQDIREAVKILKRH